MNWFISNINNLILRTEYYVMAAVNLLKKREAEKGDLRGGRPVLGSSSALGDKMRDPDQQLMIHD